MAIEQVELSVMIRRLCTTVTSTLYVVRTVPSVLIRERNPLTWIIKRLFTEWKFQRVSVKERSFVATVTGAPIAQVKSIYNELNAGMDASNNESRSSTIVSMITNERLVLYAIVRILKPDTVVETGVYSGYGSAAILQALEDNGGSGALFSIDLPSGGTILEDGRQYATHSRSPGWVVPDHLRSRWHLELGDAKVVLPDLLSQIESMDIFIHDSLHTEEHMMWEYETAWPYLKTGGLLLSHDISVSFPRFSRMHSRQFHCTGPMIARYGAIIK